MARLTMRPSTLVRRALKVAEVLRKSKKAVPSGELVKTVRLPRHQVSELLSILRKAGCRIESLRGKGAGYRWMGGPRNLAKAVEKLVLPAKPVPKRVTGKRPEACKQVLEILRKAKGKWVTGSALAEKMGVSRQRIHQFIAKLRDMGYKIEGQPKRGYRLVGGRAKCAASRKGS